MVIQTSPSSPSPLAGPSRADDAVPHSGTQRAGVMARLHALFPTHTSDPPQGEVPQRRVRPSPKFLKVRILTWNMHDSLPKGDPEDLLGAIHDREMEATVPGVLPDLPLDSQHPYHLIVVAGQECPSVSGIPMGLGAGFKLNKERDRSKEKDKDKDREKESSSERPRSVHHHLSSHLPIQLHDHEKPRDAEDDRRRAHHLSLRRPHYHHSEEDDLSLSANASAHDLLGSLHHTYGWTSMLEDWFCHGGRLAAAPHHPANDSDTMSKNSDDISVSSKAKSTGDLNGRMQEMQRGPYELLIKERMMGLYLVIFIKRDCRNLVRGMSRSSVTAGLIGGRVGNKGGVGISINLDGTTLLFLNAHLAAHEGKIQHRLANLAKIKAELSVDTFLPPDDPRMMAEDITDRFDFTFICGDLNFRLDITRLHADWLISRRDYVQALAFDQLRKVMQDGAAFVGFNEASIDFPPTFKYDVIRAKRSKHRHSKRISKNVAADSTRHEKLLTEIEERRQEVEEEQVKSDDEPEQDVDGEAISVASTSYTRYTTEGEDTEKERYDYFIPPSSPRINASTSKLVNKVLTSTAAHKAKAKWVSLVASSVPHAPIRKWAKFAKSSDGKSRGGFDPPLSPAMPDSPPLEFKASTLPPTPDTYDSEHSKELAISENRLSVPPTMGERTSSTRSTSKSDERDEEEEEKFNYDSSHKQRVPSWCDRILWKTTVEPEPEPIEEEIEPSQPSRNRMGSFLHVLRPASLRSRKDSFNSLEVTPTSPHHPGELGVSRAGSQEPDSRNSLDRPPASAFRTLSHSRSIDAISHVDRAVIGRSKSHMPLHDDVRSRKPSLPSLTNPHSSTLPPSSLQQSAVPPSALSPKELLPSPTPVASLWRNFSFLPFLSKDAIPHNVPPDRPPTPESPPPPPPRRGDVVCLSYDTLDDMAMRRLQGKSDHRPVIGSYALYI